MKLRTTPKIILLALFAFLIGFSSLKAQSMKHKVQDEETLFGIAQEYHVTVQQLKKWNNLSGNTISIGQILLIKHPAETQEAASGSYTVKPNDTLFSIAQKHGVSVAQLQRWNSLNGTAIKVGQVLKVKASSVNQSETPPVPKEKPEPVKRNKTASATKEAADGYYTVKSGDTLFRIAQLYGMEVERLKTLNGLGTNNIHVGQELKVEAGSSVLPENTAKPGAVIQYKLKQGMDLKELLRIFEMTKGQFKKLNPEMKATYINKGQVVKIIVPNVENDAITTGGSTRLTVLGTSTATKYNAGRKGTVTTNGELYNPKALTAAHATMAIGSVIFVKNRANDRGIIVRINDRITQDGLKLSKAAWQALGLSGSSNQVIMYRINE